jgi:thiamine biosynthesis lipoprotein
MGDHKPTSRRDFLRGKAAVEALLERTRQLAESATQVWEDATVAASQRSSTVWAAGRSRQPVPRLSLTRRAMACEFVIEFYEDLGTTAAEAAVAALDEIDRLEAQLTVYRDNSEVLELNRRAATQPVAVEPHLFGLLQLAQEISSETGRAFDITSGPLSQVWGFSRRQGRLPDPGEIEAALARVDSGAVLLDPPTRCVRFARPDVEIQLNSIGKGYALDRAAQHLIEGGQADFLLHGGSSSVLARGVQRGASPHGWRVAVPHPYDRSRSIGELRLCDEAAGTAGSDTQFFEAGGRRYGHLLDPRTGWPAEGVLRATAVAATAAEADALATAFYVMGPGSVAEFCARHPQYKAVLVCPRDPEGVAVGDQTSGTEPPAFDVHALNFSPREWIPADLA